MWIPRLYCPRGTVMRGRGLAFDKPFTAVSGYQMRRVVLGSKLAQCPHYSRDNAIARTPSL